MWTACLRNGEDKGAIEVGDEDFPYVDGITLEVLTCGRDDRCSECLYYTV